jgi:hypothetical protein
VLTARASMVLVLAAAGVGAGAHTVDLGTVVVPNACTSVQAAQNAYGMLQRQTSVLTHTNGVAPLSVVMMPTRALPEGKPDVVMARCAMQAKGAMPAGALVQPDTGAEDRFRTVVNNCLAAGHAGYEIRWAVLQRGATECP